ncbi:hypothetical protein BT69DRAFT_1285696 [Atractiella rhizophila]|nr:hypothetical protein BT69DRAFT_1285696 [Atractiella rhizophila]
MSIYSHSRATSNRLNQILEDHELLHTVQTLRLERRRLQQEMFRTKHSLRQYGLKINVQPLRRTPRDVSRFLQMLNTGMGSRRGIVLSWEEQTRLEQVLDMYKRDIKDLRESLEDLAVIWRQMHARLQGNAYGDRRTCYDGLPMNNGRIGGLRNFTNWWY